MDISTLILNVFFAIIPSVILCFYVYKMDIIEKEPIVMLFRLFFLGVLITVPAAYMEKSLISITGLGTNPDGYLDSFLMAFFIVALIEEGYKYLILYFGTWHNKNFDHIYDAIVYAVFISLGFATLENILYVYESGAQTAILRALISVPAHAFYAVASGYYLGLAKLNKTIGYNKAKIGYIILSILIPISLHGVFDFLLFTSNDLLLWVFFGFVALLYMLSYYKIKRVYRAEITCNISKEGGSKDERNI